MTPENGGPRTYAHPAGLYELPEWEVALAALAAVAHAAKKVLHLDWIAAVDNAVRALPYGDCCSRCRVTRFPHQATVADGGLSGRYRCACGHEWTCGWALDAPLLM